MASDGLTREQVERCRVVVKSQGRLPKYGTPLVATLMAAWTLPMTAMELERESKRRQSMFRRWDKVASLPHPGPAGKDK